VVFSPEPVRDYRDYLAVDDRYSHAHWLFQHNGGVFLPPWGKSEQWLISVQHETADIDRLISNFGTFAAAIGHGRDLGPGLTTPVMGDLA
jgi:glutamate-1-semialdehyde 2,1-aminomutase